MCVTAGETGFMVISCQMPELLQHADVSHAKYQSVPSNKCTSCSSSDLPRCQPARGTPGDAAVAVRGCGTLAAGFGARRPRLSLRLQAHRS